MLTVGNQDVHDSSGLGRVPGEETSVGLIVHHEVYKDFRHDDIGTDA